MSSLAEFEACLSVPSALLTPRTDTTNTAVLIALVIFIVAAGIVRYASPPRLARILITAIASVEKIYLEALETGLLSASDIDTAEMLSTLQLKVSKIREASLRNSLSHSGTLRDFFGGRTFTLLRCIHEVRVLEIHIEDLEGSPAPRRQPTSLRELRACSFSSPSPPSPELQSLKYAVRVNHTYAL
ncbi:hypothetical protein B0H13DRAFT_2308332 [Mycena leptocephala]|nr:hypothetical protein B0H13DRAFT_2308332 [Mycena leptocephala]